MISLVALSSVGLGSGGRSSSVGLYAVVGAVSGGTDIGKGMVYGAIGGAVFTTLTSQNFSNLTRSGKFLNNEKMFSHLISEPDVSCQEIIDYFGFEGEYNPNITSKRYQSADYWGATNSNTGKITYGNLAFENYATLKGTYIKEYFHSQKIFNGIALEKLPDDLQGYRYGYIFGRNRWIYASL